MRARTRAGHARRERGQVVILFVALFTAIAVIAAIVVDFGLWFSERRGAQKDADLAALAGAWELIDVTPGPEDADAAMAAAEAMLGANNQTENASLARPVVVDDSCFASDPRDTSGVPDSVTVDVRHRSRSLFASIFGLLAPDIGAHAKACAGSLYQAEGLFPIAVPMTGNNSDCFTRDASGKPVPVFGSTCAMALGAGQGSSGETGTIRLFNDGSLECSARTTGGNRELLDEVRQGGANTTCSIGDLIYPQTGVGSNPLRSAVRDLLSLETQAGYLCDERFGTDANVNDDFLEVVEQIRGAPWPSTTAVFAHRDCVSPRLVQLIIIDAYDTQGNQPSEILAFANFFIAGCERVDDSVSPPRVLEFSNTCELQGQQGQIRLRGLFVNILETNGPVGPRNNFGTPAIALVE